MNNASAAPAQKPVAAKAIKPKPLDWIYWGVFFGCLVPVTLAIYGIVSGSVNIQRDLKVVYNQFGYVGLILLVASLACTPLRTVSGWPWPARLRKMLGLFGFMYVCFHAFLYTGLDQGLAALPYFTLTKGEFSFGWLTGDYWNEVKRVAGEIFSLNNVFLMFGVSAFILLVPLAVTSTNGMIKRVGGKRWQMLHKLAYVIGILGVLHFFLGIKGKDKTEAIVVGAILVVLLGVRVWKAISGRKPAGKAVAKQAA